ncbi:translation initiation factor IF-2 subunit beta [Candidatus Woesearchaeota archaeon]|jgi:translation initiation factor 2 subunit 2|nr:translation initiation factor IF-2 subunit beta [Candidatus Woesearchaeota archaeon]MBT7062725.1 translation initiation factor IF-2 subunit beta [Candidatus Woesearchaeota archaeon]MBT7402851.1 translation initiation factor IF-2 subunit beta [Candidatus Woesearchaeota archaeon]
MAFKHKYEDMLKKAYKQLPEVEATDSRFEIPKVHGRLQGNRTIITNFNQIASYLRRDESHFLKFMVRELATTCEVNNGAATFVGKHSPSVLNTKIEKYVKEFVLCKQCGKPDTELIVEKDDTFKRCEACGSKVSIRSIK